MSLVSGESEVRKETCSEDDISEYSAQWGSSSSSTCNINTTNSLQSNIITMVFTCQRQKIQNLSPEHTLSETTEFGYPSMYPW